MSKLNQLPQSPSDAGLSLAELRFHIGRHDSALSATSDRASNLLATSSLVLAASSGVYALDLGRVYHGNRALTGFVGLTLLAAIVLTIVAMWNALSAIVRVTSSRNMYGDFPFRGLYNQSDIVSRFDDFPAFSDFLDDYTLGDDAHAARAELWIALRSRYLRHQRVRNGIRLLVAATVFFLIGVTLTLATSIIWP